MNEQPAPSAEQERAAPPPPSPRRPEDPIAALKEFFERAKRRFKEAIEDAREAAQETSAALREEYERRAGRRKQ